MTFNVITADEFKQRAFQIIPIPGFKPEDPEIYIQIRSTGIMNLLASGKIPNTLLGKVTELFGDVSEVKKDSVAIEDITDAQKREALAKLNKSDTGIKDMAELLRVFAEASMVQPSYAEVSEYMTDEQLMSIFSAMYGEVKQAETFRSDT